MANPFFSIVIPSYNRASSIKESIDSVLTQSFKSFEVIVVDDASTDNTQEVMEEYSANPQVLYHRNEVNLERCRSRNKGFDLSNGQYICCLDSDDLFLENHLQSLHDQIESSEEKKIMILSHYKKVHADGKSVTRKYFPIPTNKRDIVNYLFDTRTCFGIGHSCMHREILKEFRFYDDIYLMEDSELLMRIATKYDVVLNTEPNLLIRQFPDRSIDSPAYLKEQMLRLKGLNLIDEGEVLKPFVDNDVKKEVFAYMYYRIAIHFDAIGNSSEARKYAWKSILAKPAYQPKINWLLLLYSLPGGFVLRKLKSRFKS